MKDGVRILNFSRAALVRDEDIIAALGDGKVSAYVTDFPTDDVIGVEGVIAIPHLGASTPESEENCAQMAADQLVDFLENGNIRNSVNLPAVSAERSTETRICVVHENIPNMLAQISGLMSKQKINIENMVNKSRGNYAYTILDIVASDFPEENADFLSALGGIISVRVIK
jgi:D-3-phosphoglycerate dehydrogenase